MYENYGLFVIPSFIIVHVQLFREWAGHGVSGEGVSNAAAAQHHQTQGGAVSRVGGLAGTTGHV